MQLVPPERELFNNQTILAFFLINLENIHFGYLLPEIYQGYPDPEQTLQVDMFDYL